MRKSFLILCFIVIAVCLLLVFKPKHHSTEPTETFQTDRSEQQVTVKKSEEINTLSQTESTPKAVSERINDWRQLSPVERTNKLRQLILSDWQRPIEFFGKVIDENSNLVAGAHINFHWMEAPSENGSRSLNTESDVNGLFSLQNAKGPTLSIVVNKEGYYTSRSTSDSFRYDGDEPFQASWLEPIVFHLRKKKEGVDLIQKDFPPGIGQIWQLRHDGTPIELDFLNGSQNIVGSGQLKLEFWRDVSDRNASIYNWKLQLSIPNGGLVPTDQEFAFEAPEKNYQPSLVIEMLATNRNWRGEVRSKYYIQLPDKKYGRIDFYFLPYNGVFTVHSAINPTGSRNLEPND